MRPGSPLGRGLPLSLSIRGKTPFVQAKLDQGHGPVSGSLLLDTGAVGAITMYAQFLKSHPSMRPKRSIPLTSGAILPGQFVARVGRIKRVQAGNLIIRDAVANFSANAEADDAAPGDAGLIGGYVLSRYVVTIDYARHRAVLAPGQNSDRPYAFDASGLSFVAADPGFETKKVRLVLEGSPAAEAGIKAGDLLLALDDTPASGLSLAKLRQMLRVIGARYTLRLRRGGQDIEVQLVTRWLI